MINEVKYTVPWTLLMILQKINQREFRTEKVIRKKAINYMLTLISVGFLGVCFEVVGEVKLPLLSKTC